MRGSDDEAREAFEAEMLPHIDAAFRLARALTGRQLDAEDLVQDSYLRAFAGFRTYKRGTNARARLLTIVRRTFLNNQRKLSNRPVTSSLNAGDREIEPPDTRSPGTGRASPARPGQPGLAGRAGIAARTVPLRARAR